MARAYETVIREQERHVLSGTAGSVNYAALALNPFGEFPTEVRRRGVAWSGGRPPPERARPHIGFLEAGRSPEKGRCGSPVTWERVA